MSRFNTEYGNMKLQDRVEQIGTLNFGDAQYVPIVLTVDVIDHELDWFKGYFVTSHSYKEVGETYVASYESCCRHKFLSENAYHPFLIAATVNIPSLSIEPNSPPTVWLHWWIDDANNNDASHNFRRRLQFTSCPCMSSKRLVATLLNLLTCISC